ncbi:MAG: type I methionyl aminopeptidase [Solirubrobacteraceae bacterium]|nr:type I methionyl aminopeptidase [Solirubrobacteraceae bacterium]
MSIETPDELEAMERVGALVASVLAELRAAVAPGVTTGALDELAARAFKRAGATSGPADIVGFPGTICISVNEEVVHGVPGRRVLREGDLVTLDVTPLLDGFCADAAVTVAVGKASPEAARLIAAADRCLASAVRAARTGDPLRLIGRATERAARSAGATVYAELVGHGVGRTMHEPPSVANVYEPHVKERMGDGLVLAIEPMIGLGRPELVTLDDGWTMATIDGSLSAHVEHTVIVRPGGGRVLTAA